MIHKSQINTVFISYRLFCFQSVKNHFMIYDIIINLLIQGGHLCGILNKNNNFKVVRGNILISLPLN